MPDCVARCASLTKTMPPTRHASLTIQIAGNHVKLQRTDKHQLKNQHQLAIGFLNEYGHCAVVAETIEYSYGSRCNVLSLKISQVASAQNHWRLTNW
jgi:hypothetical protein